MSKLNFPRDLTMQIRAVLERALEATTLKVNHPANKTISFKQSGNFSEKSFNNSNQIFGTHNNRSRNKKPRLILSRISGRLMPIFQFNYSRNVRFYETTARKRELCLIPVRRFVFTRRHLFVYSLKRLYALDIVKNS